MYVQTAAVASFKTVKYLEKQCYQLIEWCKEGKTSRSKFCTVNSLFSQSEVQDFVPSNLPR